MTKRTTTKTITTIAMYEHLDNILKRLMPQIFRLFRKYRKMSFDELNAVSQVEGLYEELQALNFEAYRKIAEYYYRQESGKSWKAKDRWLETILGTPSAVMKYSYDKEVARKSDRLVEALLATSGSVAEFDKAMRYWAQMTGWFAVEVADAAIAQAREDEEIEFVVWRSEHDNRVCDQCWKRNGRVYHAWAVPPKPHPNCRCWTEIFEEGDI